MAHAGEWNKLVDELRAEMMATGVGLPSGFGPVPWSRPNVPTGWVLANGAVLLANTPHTALRQAYIDDGFPYGQDGSGNPKVPDMRGMVPAALDNLGGTAAGRLSGATALGTIKGAQTHTLSVAEMPYHAHGVNDPTHAHSVYDPGHTHTVGRNPVNGSSPTAERVTGGGSDSTVSPAYTGISIYAAYTGISIQAAGGNAAHNNVQPTLVLSYIVKT